MPKDECVRDSFYDMANPEEAAQLFFALYREEATSIARIAGQEAEDEGCHDEKRYWCSVLTILQRNPWAGGHDLKIDAAPGGRAKSRRPHSEADLDK